MRDRSYYVAQGVQCRNLALSAIDPMTARRLIEMAEEYDALVSDLSRADASDVRPEHQRTAFYSR